MAMFRDVMMGENLILGRKVGRGGGSFVVQM